MKLKLLLIPLIVPFLLSSCSFSPPETMKGTEYEDQNNIEISSQPSSTHEISPELHDSHLNRTLVTYDREYDFAPPPYYETVFPSCYYTEPETAYASIVSSCDMLLLPTEHNAVPVWTLKKFDCVRLLSKTDSTWDQYEFILQPWYLVCVVSGDGEDSPYIGWIAEEHLMGCNDPFTSEQSFSDKNLTQYAETSGITYVPPSYRQGIVIDGCELAILPGGEAMWCLAKNSYVDILASGYPQGSNELWLYVKIACYEAESPECLWVRESEIKPYTSENMYDILDHLKISPSAQAYWENGTSVLDYNGYLRLASREESPQGTCYWLESGGGVLLFVHSLDDLVYPVPIE